MPGREGLEKTSTPEFQLCLCPRGLANCLHSDFQTRVPVQEKKQPGTPDRAVRVLSLTHGTGSESHE